MKTFVKNLVSVLVLASSFVQGPAFGQGQPSNLWIQDPPPNGSALPQRCVTTGRYGRATTSWSMAAALTAGVTIAAGTIVGATQRDPAGLVLWTGLIGGIATGALLGVAWDQRTREERCAPYVEFPFRETLDHSNIQVTDLDEVHLTVMGVSSSLHAAWLEAWRHDRDLLQRHVQENIRRLHTFLPRGNRLGGNALMRERLFAWIQELERTNAYRPETLAYLRHIARLSTAAVDQPQLPPGPDAALRGLPLGRASLYQRQRLIRGNSPAPLGSVAF